MSFPVAVPFGGIAGYQFLTATADRQRAAFNDSPVLARETAHFRERIATITTAEELVADRTLFKVALGAFGLDSEIDKKYFLRVVLEEGTDDPESLANKLVDPRYAEFSARFGFGNALGPRTGEPDFADRIIRQYEERQFEIAVGRQDTNLRLALEFERTIGDYVDPIGTARGDWLSVLGNQAMRSVFETAFGLPPEFALTDVDKQVDELSRRVESLYGSGEVAVFEDPGIARAMISRFLAQAEAQAGPTAGTPGFAALSLLSAQGGSAGAAQINLILSNA